MEDKQKKIKTSQLIYDNNIIKTYQAERMILL